MQDFTPTMLSPNEKVLNFIKNFAYNYRCIPMPDGTVKECFLG